MSQTIGKKKVGRPKKNKENDHNVIQNKVQEQKKEQNIVLYIALDENDLKNNNVDDFSEQYNETVYDTIVDNSYEDHVKNEPVIVKKTHKTTSNVKNQNFNYHCVQVIDKDGVEFKPQKTDHKCWWCDESFDNIPAYIVNNFRDNKYFIFGNFCSFNCAVTYNLRSLKDFKCNTRHALINKLRTEITGKTDVIKLAGERELLYSKGGVLSIEKFREGFSHITFDMKMNIPPIIPLVHVIEHCKVY